MLRWSPYVVAKLGEVSRTPEKDLSVLTHPVPKIARENALIKSSITQSWSIRFRSNFVQSLNVCHPKRCKSSRSRDQSSRSRRDRTCAKNRKIINNSAGDCPILLKFYTNFEHVTLYVLRTFKVNGSKVKVTSWHNVSVQKSDNSGTDKLSKIKLGENYPRAERNT